MSFRFKLRPQLPRGTAWALFTALAVVFLQLLYIFSIDYTALLVGDSADYWHRAVYRAAGYDMLPTQWEHHPPLYHIVVSWLIRLASGAGLGEARLAFVLTVQVLLNGLALFFFFKLLLNLINRWQSLVLVLIYGLVFPGVYLQSYVLSENLATPLFLMVICLLGTRQKTTWVLLMAGALLGLATGMRPQYGLLALPVFAWLWLATGRWWPGKGTLLRAVAFALGFFAIVIACLFEVNRISQGKVSSLAASGGTTFFMGHCQPKALYYKSEEGRGFYYKNMHPSRPHQGEPFSLPRPAYQQAYYYQQGLQCLVQDLNWLKKVYWLKNNFIAEAWPVSVLLLLAGSLGLFSIFFLKTGLLKVFWWQYVLTIVTTYFFVEHYRYLHPVLAPIYLLTVVTVVRLVKVFFKK